LRARAGGVSAQFCVHLQTRYDRQTAERQSDFLVAIERSATARKGFSLAA
jgi:plasmid maintenance system antidote protein VapI